MFDFSLQQLLMRFAALMLIVAVHGWAVSAAAMALGDPGPEYDGRRTLNPFSHLDLLGALGIMIFSLGWIRPIAIDPRELGSRWRLVVIPIVGVVSTLALALLARLLAPLAVTQLQGFAAATASVFLSTLVNLGLWFSLFNLLPIPPLTGGLFLLAAVPKARERAKRYTFHSKLVVGVLILTGVASSALGPVHKWLLRLVSDL